MSSPPDPSDYDLVVVLSRVPGVSVTHHYRVQEESANLNYIHLMVEDDAALHRLCQLSARVNAPLNVYEGSETEFRYCLLVNDYSRRILLCLG